MLVNASLTVAAGAGLSGVDDHTRVDAENPIIAFEHSVFVSKDIASRLFEGNEEAASRVMAPFLKVLFFQEAAD